MVGIWNKWYMDLLLFQVCGCSLGAGPGPICLQSSEILFYDVASHLQCPFISLMQEEAELGRPHHLKV